MQQIENRGIATFLLLACLYGFWDTTWGPGKEQINCPNHCGEQNIFIKGYTWVYTIGIALAVQVIGSIWSTVVLYRQWVAFTLVEATTAAAFVIFFLLGYPFNTVDNWLCAVIIPGILMLQLVAVQRDIRVEDERKKIPYEELLPYTMNIVVLIIAGVLWSFEVGSHKLQLGLLDRASGDNVIVNMSYSYDSPADRQYYMPTDRVFQSTVFECHDCVIDRLQPKLRTILIGNIALVRYLGIAVILLFPSAVFALCRLLGFTDMTPNKAVAVTLRKLYTPLAVVSLCILITPRDIVARKVNLFYYITYITGFTTPVYLTNQQLFPSLAPYVAVLNLIIIVVATTWTDTDYTGVWFHDVLPFFTMLSFSTDKIFTTQVIAAPLLSISTVTLLIILCYAVMTQSHFDLYGVVPYGDVAPPPLEAPLQWIGILIGSLMANTVLRVAALYLMGVAITGKSISSGVPQQVALQDGGLSI